ncbi:MAG: hypothetical protein A2015_16830 [Spirochaetes bacterium GWF1_31_7]|nr:MAG: hypothetical protein A2Y30_14195 [Spirochaetes bacterium GWE1_32_154]OHD50108.1 MAG: hypothetical protein A2Y29_12240 [Spirochaetes bacterium GWE2_31_10]OHD52421.1 MAG: hypothetical protein A2015_16830 [Spirochaetes bacterium GWF1_31_7]OHD73781.1 MAG: hypothetical protein A2355_10670 [Spirochaetes bacterium RIFOXYB1_FULL_32_8]HBD96065.1 hypothetical protein [Spirochaetia bacterium]
MGQNIVNREELKNNIIQAYYRRNSEDDFIDLESKASDLEEPFIIEFKKIIENYGKKSKYFSGNISSDTSEDVLEVEDIEELDDEDDFVDIDTLNEIEAVVIATLQYLNLELYDSHKIKEFITNITLTDFEKKGLSWNMKERIKNVIKNIVEHEFRELDNKKQFRKETLVNISVKYYENVLNEMIEEHKEKSIGKITTFQKKIFKEYMYKTVIANHIEEFKKKNKLNYEEVRFVDNLIKKLIIKKITLL